MEYAAWVRNWPWELWGQPVYSLQANTVWGVELLLRSARYRRLAPTAILGDAAVNGLLGTLEAEIFHAAVQTHVAEGLQRLINISAAGLRRLDPGRHEVNDAILEITEQEPGGIELVDLLNAWRRRGARIAVDDVGSGYGRLAALVYWKPELVKVDRPLVSDIHADPVKQAVLEGLQKIAYALGARLVAEGIETEQELQYLRSAGVPLGQGFLFGLPMPVYHFEEVSTIASSG